MINAIVIIATLLGAAVVGVWLFLTGFRSSVEAPKFRVLESADLFDRNCNPMSPEPSSTSGDSFGSGDGTSTQHDPR